MSTDTSKDPSSPPASPPTAPPATSKCKPLPTRTPPPLESPDNCPRKCECPTPPKAEDDCFTKMLDEQTRKLAEAERMKPLKAELSAFLEMARTARAAYTVDVRAALVERWTTADREIEELIRKLVCSVECWECLIECRLCARLNEIRRLELRLGGDGTLPATVTSLYDLQYWHQRNRDLRQAQFDRIAAVLAAWKEPHKTLDALLTANKALIDAALKNIATDSATAVYDTFARILPMHLAIAPRDAKSKIDPRYSALCTCYPGKPDTCCGPDVGELTVAQRLGPPVPYLIDVAALYDMLCCLVRERYVPAKTLLGEADAGVAQLEEEIKRTRAEIEARGKSLAADFKAGLATPIDCSPYRPKVPAPQTPPPSTSPPACPPDSPVQADPPPTSI